MADRTSSAHGRRVCMVAYCDSPTSLPPMFNEGRSLAAAGFDVEFLCFASSVAPPGRELSASGFRIRRFPLGASRRLAALLRIAARGRELPSVLRVLTYAEYVVRAFAHALWSGADLYTAHDLPPLLPTVLAAKLRRKPVVYRAHELWPETHAEVPFAWLWRLLDRALVPLCVVVTPEENRSRIYREELGARRPPLTVRNCPPYQPPIASTRIRDELERRGISFRTIVLYQGLIDPMRCIDELVEAARMFDDGIGLVIVGSGFGRWADAASKLARHERIVLLPRVAYEDLPSYTASADVGVLFYRNDCRNNYYCAPNKVFEYMMMGLPVIAANYPGMLALVEREGVGLCVDPHDPHEIAAAVNRIAADPDARMAMRANGLRLSRERYNWETEFRALFECYRTLLDASSSVELPRTAASAASRRTGRAPGA